MSTESESPDLPVGDVLAVLSDPMLSGVRSEPVRSVMVRLAVLEPNHSLSRWLLGTCGAAVPPETPWPSDDPLRPFDDPRFVMHEGVLRLAAWLPGQARCRPTTSGLNRAAAVTDSAHALFTAAHALAPSAPELRPLVDTGLRALEAGDGASALSALTDLKRVTAERGLEIESSPALAALDQLTAEADPLEVDGATRHALRKVRVRAHHAPPQAPAHLIAARRLAETCRTPASATEDAEARASRWWQPVRLRVLPPTPRRIATISMFLLPPAFVLLARDPLMRSIGPVVEVENLGQLSMLVFVAGMLLLGWALGALTRLFASHHSRLALLPVCGFALFSATHAQWVRGVIGTVLVGPNSEAINFDSAARGRLGLMLFVSLLARIAALGSPMRYDLNLWIGHPFESATYLPR